MAEKKIVTLGIRVDEPTLISVKRLAERAGITESEYARMAITEKIEKERAEWLGLNSIFGDGCQSCKGNGVQQRTTIDGLPEIGDYECRKTPL